MSHMKEQAIEDWQKADEQELRETALSQCSQKIAMEIIAALSVSYPNILSMAAIAAIVYQNINGHDFS